MRTYFSRQVGGTALAIFLLGAGAVVLAAGDGSSPRLLPYRGHIELDGTPLSGTLPLTFNLYDDETAGTQLHTESIEAGVASGNFAVLLGQATPLSDGVLTAAELFVAVTVNGTALTGRQRIGAATKVMDNPGTFTVGTLSADAVATGTLTAASSITAASVSASDVDTSTLSASAAVTTPALVLNGAGGTNGAVRGMQSGVIGACNGTDHTSWAATVNFAPAFDTVPIVMLTVGETDDAGCTSARIRGISPALFQWRSYVGLNTEPCDCIHWVAFVQD